MHSKEFQDKVALVTGATSGIGKECCKLLMQQGAHVVAIGRDPARGASLIQELQSENDRLIFIAGSVEDPVSMEQLSTSIEKRFGGIDYAINSAGHEGRLAYTTEQNVSDWHLVVDVNLKGVWLSLKHEIALMLKKGAGSIVNISSQLAERALPGTSIYSASKAGVNALTRVAAVEYGEYNIRINAISPGATDTPMLERITSLDVREGLHKKNPLKKIADAREIAASAIWLLSSYASHINGQNITIDGGHSLQIS